MTKNAKAELDLKLKWSKNNEEKEGNKEQRKGEKGTRKRRERQRLLKKMEI